MTDLQHLHSSIEAAKKWTPHELILELRTGPGDHADTVNVDLIKSIPKEPQQHLKYGNGAKNDTRWYFPPDIKEPPQIAKYMNNASCIDNKYEVISNGKSSNGNLCHIICSCGKKVCASKATTSTTTSARPKTNEETCDFKVVPGHDKEHNQWFVRVNAGHILQHNNHLPVDRDRKEVGRRNLSEDELKEAGEMLLRNVPKSIVQETIEVKTGHRLSSAAIGKIKQNMVINKFNISEGESSADVLLRMLKEDPNIEYTAYFGFTLKL